MSDAAASDRPPDDLIGHTIGAYRIVGFLGAGGMGTIWRAEHTVLGRAVAIKVLQAALSRQEAVVQRFFAEARAATRIADPGIVTVHDFGWHTDGQAFLVMELLVGESLADRLARVGRLAVVDAVRVVRQAALAMSAAHAAAIVHRDLKPDNLFIVADPAVAGGERVKILDFGIAKLLGDEVRDQARTQSGTLLGTPLYMSPEQCRDAGEVDHRTDVYSLGCVLHHALTGQPPFVGASASDTIAQHLFTPPPSPRARVPEVPEAIAAVVVSCLAKAAVDRPATMAALAEALDEPAAGRSSGDRPAVTGPPTRAARAATTTDVGLLNTLASGAIEAAPRRERAVGTARLAIGAATIAIALGAFGVTRWLRDRSTPAASATEAEPGLDPVDADAGSTDAAPTDTAPTDAAPTDAASAEAGPPIDAAPAIDARRRRGGYDPYAER